MRKYQGGEPVKAGFYWHAARWGAEIVQAAGGTLPGETGEVYFRIPWPVLLVAAPIMGGAFAMFLPFIGLAMLAQFGWTAVTRRRGLRQGAVRT